MAVYIAAVHLTGGTQHENISAVVWVNDSTFRSGISTVDAMVAFIDSGNQVKVSDGTTTVFVGVVRESNKAPYLRSFADKVWTDNLLSMPTY